MSAVTRRFHPGAFTLTFGMHSISTGFEAGYPQRPTLHDHLSPLIWRGLFEK